MEKTVINGICIIHASHLGGVSKDRYVSKRLGFRSVRWIWREQNRWPLTSTTSYNNPGEKESHNPDFSITVDAGVPAAFHTSMPAFDILPHVLPDNLCKLF